MTGDDREQIEGRGIDRPKLLSSLGTKLILLVFASTTITALLVSWISIQDTSATLRSMIERLHPNSLEHASRRISPWIEQVRYQLERAEHHATDSGPLDPGEYAPMFDGLALFEADAVPIQSWGQLPEGTDRARGQPQRLAPVTLEDGRAALAVAPLSQRAGPEPVAVVALSRLVPLLEGELPSPSTFLALVDTEGRVLASTGVPPTPGLGDRIPLSALGAPGTVRETEIDGMSLTGAARPTGLLNWQLVVVTPFQAAYAPVLSMVTRVLAIDLCIIALFSLLAYRFTARLVRPIAQLSDAARLVSQGETDVEVPELCRRDEIGLLARTFDQMLSRQRRQREEIEETLRSLSGRNARLEQANEELSQLSITDELTKLHNHRFFQDHLTREIRRVERTGEQLAILLIDLDNFKRLNDRLGHAAGDEVLFRVARILDDSLRASDLCARYGGEEFVVLAPNTSIEGAYRLAEKIRTTTCEASFIVDDSMRPLRVTLSIGVATFGGDRKAFFQQADQALYEAKANGKNCVVVQAADVEPGDPPPETP